LALPSWAAFSAFVVFVKLVAFVALGALGATAGASVPAFSAARRHGASVRSWRALPSLRALWRAREGKRKGRMASCSGKATASASDNTDMRRSDMRRSGGMTRPTEALAATSAATSAEALAGGESRSARCLPVGVVCPSALSA